MNPVFKGHSKLQNYQIKYKLTSRIVDIVHMVYSWQNIAAATIDKLLINTHSLPSNSLNTLTKIIYRLRIFMQFYISLNITEEIESRFYI